ncbi:TetR family transcriptional regulator [Kineosporia sp. NBRC 101731]|uniref:TetR family transcriptional regulator n=1 Tax=Kineosporia sp. NBRC 101731 TaxID=3032199 RepID=UPI0024A139DF|nr:TetR family transcriptional regulator [Kineosporia sp. NBRC 101731]GLY33137.1 TetR family transcriptional regulator [Kineosporia sp. NBRC 101731]
MATGQGLRERKRAASRAFTVEAALRLFAEHGYENVTVADICTAADIAPRTFFRYFATKEELLAEPARVMAARIREIFAVAPLELDDAAVLSLALRDLGDYVLEHREQLVVLQDAAVQASRVSPHLRLADRERRLATDLVNRAMSPGGQMREPDWRTRLLVAQGLAALRIWMQDVLDPAEASSPRPADDPMAHLGEILAS